jgi:hypothetical protein
VGIQLGLGSSIKDTEGYKVLGNVLRVSDEGEGIIKLALGSL